MDIKLKRVYEAAAEEDGRRILIDRLWPRGLTKQKARVDLWLKQIAPSTTLRKWFQHDPGKWMEFRKRYRQELKENKAAVEVLRAALKGSTVTLLYAARDQKHNEAQVLRELLTLRKIKCIQKQIIKNEKDINGIGLPCLCTKGSRSGL